MTDRWNAEGPPTQPIGESCLSFTVRGDWAHFRRVEGNIVKQTYRIIPRTTLAGLIAAMLGLDRDSYYDLFSTHNSGVAIEPASPLRTINMPINSLSTAGDDIQMHPSRGNARVGLVDPTNLRQQHNYEFLVDPAYRIDIWLDDKETYEELKSILESGVSHYIPSLGLSECLASLEYHGEMPIESGSAGDEGLDSVLVEAIDAVRIEQGQRIRVERSPGFMEYDGNGRKTSKFIAHAYTPDLGAIAVDDVPICTVDGRTVMFS